MTSNFVETETGGCTKNITLGKALIRFSPEIKSLVRKQEKTLIKCKKKAASVVFNEQCIKENLLPKYTIYIYIYIYIYVCICFFFNSW